MSEAYLAEYDADQAVYGNIRAGQTFTPFYNHTIMYVDLGLRSPCDPAKSHVEIFDLWKPDWFNQRPVSYSTRPYKRRPFKDQPDRIRYGMHPAELIMDNPYAIILRNVGDPAPDPLYWLHKSSGNPYERGHRILRPDAGQPWQDFLDQDHLFAELGFPPMPLSKYDPPIPNWLAIQINWAAGNDYNWLRVYTTVPCHLWAYHTAAQPTKSWLTRITRGLPTLWYSRAVVREYYQFEQLEDGDTLEHTFRMTILPFIGTIYTVLRGMINNTQVSSTSPIIKWRRPTIQLYDKWNTGDNTAFSVAPNQAKAQTFTTTTTHTIQAVRLKLYKTGSPPPTYFYIQDTLPTGQPGSTRYYVWRLPAKLIPPGNTPPDAQWVEVPIFSTIKLTKNTRYAIALRNEYGDPSNCPRWNIQSPGYYTGGNYFYQVAWWPYWATWIGADFMFEEYGLKE